MDDNQKFIRENIQSLLSHRKVKTKASKMDGGWELFEIHYARGLPSNIEFSVVFTVGADRCVRVAGKINRETSTFSHIEVFDL